VLKIARESSANSLVAWPRLSEEGRNLAWFDHGDAQGEPPRRVHGPRSCRHVSKLTTQSKNVRESEAGFYGRVLTNADISQKRQEEDSSFYLPCIAES